MQRLTALDPSAIKLIRRLEKTARDKGDDKLLGYAYYRYAYYYYFTVPDVELFRKHMQDAIRFLLRSGDREYLAGTYNLVAYDAQDHGVYDLAYAYFRLAVYAAEPLKGISLPGLVEASAGRLMIELGQAKEGRAQIKSAIKKMRPITTMHVYHYNMIFTYADEALASFILRDIKSVDRAIGKINAHVEKAPGDERQLSMSYVLLPAIYHAVLCGDKDTMQRTFQKLYRAWKSQPEDGTGNLIFEVENLFAALLKHGFVRQAGRLLKETADMGRGENLNIAMRHFVMQHTYYVRTRNVKKQQECLLAQHEILKKRNAELTRIHRYTRGFLDMIGEITAEHADALKEQEELTRRSVTDALTGLPNRAAMNQELAAMFEHAQKKGLMFAVGIMDVDRFKQFNDRYGHQTGDACLKKIGGILKPVMEEGRIFCARYGGDEFVICFAGCTKKQIRRVVSRIADEAEKIRLKNGNRTIEEAVKLSHGISSSVPASGQRLWDYLSAADDALYRMKRSHGHILIN